MCKAGGSEVICWDEEKSVSTGVESEELDHSLGQIKFQMTAGLQGLECVPRCRPWRKPHGLDWLAISRAIVFPFSCHESGSLTSGEWVRD